MPSDLYAYTNYTAHKHLPLSLSFSNTSLVGLSLWAERSFQKLQKCQRAKALSHGFGRLPSKHKASPLMSSTRWPSSPSSLSLPPLPNAFMIYAAAACLPPHPISLFITHCAALPRFIYFIMFSTVTSLISFLIFLLSSLLAAASPLPLLAHRCKVESSS